MNTVTTRFTVLGIEFNLTRFTFQGQARWHITTIGHGRIAEGTGSEPAGQEVFELAREFAAGLTEAEFLQAQGWTRAARSERYTAHVVVAGGRN